MTYKLQNELQFQRRMNEPRFFSSNKDDKEAKEANDTIESEKGEENESKESLRDTINRLKGEDDTNTANDGGGNSDKSDNQTDEILRNVSSAFDSFSTSLSETWGELINSNQPKDVNKKIDDWHTSRPGNVDDDDNEAADKYEGTTAVMIIDESENLNAYERIQKRLSEAPLIQDIFKAAEEVYDKSGAAQAREKMSHVAEDAREAWETSQNPWVYRVSSVYDTITAESESAMAERELRELDPHFSLEDWKRGLAEVTLPRIMALFLEGRIKELKPTLGEAVYNRLAAESRARKKEGVYIDTNVLGINNSQVDIVSITPDAVNKGSPIITVHFMCQQINCVRKKETGEIVEGAEDDIRAYSYIVAMQREYDEEKGELNWKIMDLMLNGAIAYL